MTSQNSTSYLYLAVAQSYNISYGEVLRYVDLMDLGYKDWAIASLQLRKLPHDVLCSIRFAWDREQERRRVALAP